MKLSISKQTASALFTLAVLSWTACTQSPAEVDDDGDEPAKGVSNQEDDQGSNQPAKKSNKSGDPGSDVEIPDPDSQPEESEKNPDCDDDEEYDFSVIWVANSPEGTVSKIDTRTATELARYRTGPKKDVDPSRTSVSLTGLVAIANRKGSVTVIAPRLGKCVDKNGDGKIQTSQGAQDVLEWGQDECVLWHHDLGAKIGGGIHTGGPRAVAWGLDDGEKDECGDPLSKLWVGYREVPKDEVVIKKLSTDGELLDEARVPDWKGIWNNGFYGGAIGADGGFWGMGTRGTLIHVDPITMDVERYDDPDGAKYIPYGVAADAKGRIWMGGYRRGELIYFDSNTEDFTVLEKPDGAPNRLRGVTVTKDNQVWVATNAPCGLGHFDANTMQWVNSKIELKGCSVPVGVGLDAEGLVWVVDQGAQKAFRYNPKTQEIVTVEGLKRPYSYSDMTGAGLRVVEEDSPPQ